MIKRMDSFNSKQKSSKDCLKVQIDYYGNSVVADLNYKGSAPKQDFSSANQHVRTKILEKLVNLPSCQKLLYRSIY